MGPQKVGGGEALGLGREYSQEWVVTQERMTDANCSGSGLVQATRVMQCGGDRVSWDLRVQVA